MVEVTNSPKVFNLLEKVSLGELRTEVCNTTGGSEQNHPKAKEVHQGKAV